MSTLDDLLFGKIDNTVYTRKLARAELTVLRIECDTLAARVAKLEAQQPDAVTIIDAALAHGYTTTTETPLDGYGREVLESIKRDIEAQR